jgi:hypothetical protein
MGLTNKFHRTSCPEDRVSVCSCHRRCRLCRRSSEALRRLLCSPQGQTRRLSEKRSNGRGSNCHDFPPSNTGSPGMALRLRRLRIHFGAAEHPRDLRIEPHVSSLVHGRGRSLLPARLRATVLHGQHGKSDRTGPAWAIGGARMTAGHRYAGLLSEPAIIFVDGCGELASEPGSSLS